MQEFIDEWHSDAQAVLVHTSGSTGAPKPMWAEKAKMLNSARITCDFLGLKHGDTALLCLPLDYIAGKMMVVRSIERGMRLVSVEPSNRPLESLVEAPVFAAMVPSQVYSSLDNLLLPRIKHLIIGGGAVSKELENELRRLASAYGSDCCHFWSTYGMTETLSHIALRSITGSDASEWYTPFDGVGISQTDDGCLIIDAPNVHDGQLVTNDIVEIADGRFRVLGRKDNVICSGGIKLQIEQMEEKLSQYIRTPFCITKRRDKKFGEIAILLLTEQLNWRDICRQCLNQYEIPKEAVLVTSIPMTRTGKIDRAKAAVIGS